MPTYQYACTECGHDLEAVQSFTDDALTECPACDGRLRKVFSAVGIVFKGSGFYRNDSRDKKAAGEQPRPRSTPRPTPPRATPRSPTPRPTSRPARRRQGLRQRRSRPPPRRRSGSSASLGGVVHKGSAA